MVRQYDVVIIGAGPGGMACARSLRSYGKSVLLCEKNALGGVCLNSGCMPTKFRIRFGKDKDCSSGQKQMVEKLQLAIEKSLTKSEIDIAREFVEVVDDGVYLTESNKIINAETVVLAVGSLPRAISSIDIDNKRVWFAEDFLWNWPQKKLRRVDIIGMGAIGVEFAFMLLDWVEERIICWDVADRMLVNEDPILVKYLRRKMEKTGKIELRLSEKFYWEDDTEIVLIAAGRRPPDLSFFKRGDLALDERGFIKVDDFFQTSIEGVYAIGDCIGRYMLAHTASFEGRWLAGFIAKKYDFPASYPPIVRCVFSDPPIASVGKDYNLAVEWKELPYPFGEMMFLYPEVGRIRVGLDEDGKIVYAGIFGPGSPEILPLFSLCISSGLSLEELRNLMYPHPTLSEAIAHL